MPAHLLRMLVVTSWLAAVAWHWARHYVPSAGVRAPAFAAHCDQHLHYALGMRRTASGAPVRLGGCSWSCSHRGGLLRETASLRIEDATLLPGWSTLCALLPDPELRTLLHRVSITLLSDHDESGRCTALDASCTCASLTGTGHATLAPARLELSWSAGASVGRREYPGIAPVVGLELLAVVPEQLRPGDRCTLSLITLDTASGAPRARQIVLHAIAREEVETPLGWQSLLRLESWDGEERIAMLWCDPSGLIWRQRWEGIGLDIDLDQRDEPGETP